MTESLRPRCRTQNRHCEFAEQTEAATCQQNDPPLRFSAEAEAYPKLWCHLLYCNSNTLQNQDPRLLANLRGAEVSRRRLVNLLG